MADSTIFLMVQNKLTPLVETPFENEPLLQKLVADFPEVLVGPATAGEVGKPVLVAREVPVPSGSHGLSLDHLFLTRDAVPVLVEVKRSSDTRARREVVAQMLDYAANGTQYWDVARLQQLLTQTHGASSAEVLQREFADAEFDDDTYWRAVGTNLRAGRVRLIFIADRLSAELVRIIEFLNEQMHDTEVLGVEVPQYASGAEHVAYVPRVVGKTAQAVDAKGGAGHRWDEATLLEVAERDISQPEQQLLRRLFAHTRKHSGRFSWGSGASPGVTGWYSVDGKETPVWNVSLGGRAATATLYFIFGEYGSRHGAGRTTAYAQVVAEVPGMEAKVTDAQAKGLKGWSPLPLAQATAHTEKVFAALQRAIS